MVHTVANGTGLPCTVACVDGLVSLTGLLFVREIINDTGLVVVTYTVSPVVVKVQLLCIGRAWKVKIGLALIGQRVLESFGLSSSIGIRPIVIVGTLTGRRPTRLVLVVQRSTARASVSHAVTGP